MKSFAYSINIYPMGLKVKFFLVKKMSIVARGVRPVLILPIADLSIAAQIVGPVVPAFPSSGIVRLSVLLIILLDIGQKIQGENLACLCECHDVGKISGHRGNSFLDDVLLSHMREERSRVSCQENVNASCRQNACR